MPNQRKQGSGEGSGIGMDAMSSAADESNTNAEASTSETVDKAREFLDQAKSTASDAYGSVTQKATSALEQKKAGLSGGLTSVADSIRNAGNALNETDEKNYVTEYTARYAQTGAQKLEQVARYFETKDLRSIASDTQDFARRNPAVFLGGAFVLGILAARFLKSSPGPSGNSSEFSTGSYQQTGGTASGIGIGSEATTNAI